jgi:O-antigen/teichoic acid export membrane protein
MKQSQTIVKNAVFGIAASIIGGGVYLATILMIAHKASVVEFGKYSFVLAFAMFFQLIADSGLPRMMIREISKDPENLAPILGASVSLIWLISVGVWLVIAAIVPFLHFGLDVKIAVLLMSAAALSTFHAAGYSAVLRAFEDNELNYLGSILHKIVLFALILITIQYHTGIVGFVTAHLIANFLLWFFYQITVSRLYAHVPMRVDKALWKSLIISALPMGGGVMLRQLALQLDILVLTWMTNLTTVGLFSGPYRISMALRVVPQTLALPLFPLYSRTAHFSPARFATVYQQSMKFFAILSIPVAAFFLAWSGPVLRLALGKKFIPALPAMEYLGIGMVPFFLSVLFQYLFAALDEQKRFLFSTVLSSIIRVGLLVILIPKLGFVGPAVAFVCAETFIVGLWIFQLARLGYPPKLGHVFLRPVIAGGAMAFVLFTARDASIVWQIGAAALGGIVYIAALFVLRTFSAEEIGQAREGIAFVSPFIESWSKKLKRDT